MEDCNREVMTKIDEDTSNNQNRKKLFIPIENQYNSFNTITANNANKDRVSI